MSHVEMSTVLVRPFPDDMAIINQTIKGDYYFGFEDATISTVNRPDGTVAFIAVTLPFLKSRRLKKELAKVGAPVSYLN